MNNNPRNTLIVINLYGIVDKAVFTSYSLFIVYPEAVNSSTLWNVTSFWPEWGRNVNMVEIYSQVSDEDAVDDADAEFCIDDLLVE